MAVEHVSTQGTLQREHVNTQGTLAREHVSMQGTLAREDVSTQGTLGAGKVCNLADSNLMGEDVTLDENETMVSVSMNVENQ